MHCGRVHALTRCGNQIRFGVSRAQSFSNFQQLILYIIDVGLDWDVFSMVVWSLWYRRKQVRVGNSIPPIGQTLA